MSSVTVTLGGLQDAAARLRGPFRARVARKGAEFMQEHAREGAPKDTTAMAQSISVETHDFSDYELNVEIAQQANPRATFFPPPNSDVGPEQAVVLVGATYARFVNDGTIHQSAIPFFDRARVATAAALPSIAEAEWKAT